MLLAKVLESPGSLSVLPLPISLMKSEMASYRHFQDSTNALTEELMVSLKLSSKKKHLLIESDRLRLFSNYLACFLSMSIRYLTLKLF